jgi:hypothetical protein
MRAALLIVATACAVLTVAAPPRSAAEIRVRIPVSYRSWEFSDSSASVTAAQWVAPVVASFGLSQGVELLLQGAAQSGTVDAHESSSLSGATDARAALRWNPAGGRLLLEAGVNIPTGTRELDEEQQRVAFALAPPFLGYRVRQAGRGFDAGGGIILAFPLSDGWALGVGGSYLHRGSFRALKDGPEIRPGGEITASAGFDGKIGGTNVRLDGTRRIYGRDEGEGTDYKEPAVWEGSLAAGAEGLAWGFNGALLLSHKEEAETGSSPYSGNYLGGSLELRRSLGSTFRMGVGGEVVRFRSAGNEAETFESTTGGVGPSFVLSLGERTRFEGRLRRLMGTLDSGSADSESIEGWDAIVALSLIGGSADR